MITEKRLEEWHAKLQDPLVWCYCDQDSECPTHTAIHSQDAELIRLARLGLKAEETERAWKAGYDNLLNEHDRWTKEAERRGWNAAIEAAAQEAGVWEDENGTVVDIGADIRALTRPDGDADRRGDE